MEGAELVSAPMEIKPIRLEADYEETLTAVSRLMSAEVGMAEHDYFDVTTTLIEAYEARNFAIAARDPIATIEYEAEKRGLIEVQLRLDASVKPTNGEGIMSTCGR